LRRRPRSPANHSACDSAEDLVSYRLPGLDMINQRAWTA
jgi:hypothetical protein